MLATFWSEYSGGGFHSKDEQFIERANSYKFQPAASTTLAADFESNELLHKLVHVDLYPQPYVGNLDRSLVYILFGNPGFVAADYDDELKNPSHMAACIANLKQSGQGFYPLLPAGSGTGAGNYWQGRLRSLTADLAQRLHLTSSQANQVLVDRLSVVEAGAYHSKKFPGDWFDQLPSSRAARDYVHGTLLPKARRGEVLILVWRRAAFWGVPESTAGVLHRPPEKAQLKNITAVERAAMAEFIAERLRNDI